MKLRTEYLTLDASSRREYINITLSEDKALARSGIKEGMVLVSVVK